MKNVNQISKHLLMMINNVWIEVIVFMMKNKKYMKTKLLKIKCAMIKVYNV